MPKIKVKYDDGTSELVEDTPENRVAYGLVDASEAQQRAGKSLSSFIGQTLPAIGGLAGGTLGPAGGAAGSALGSIVQQTLQQHRPDMFGKAPETGGEALADIGIEAGSNLLFDIPVGKLTRSLFGVDEPLKTVIARKFIKKPVDPDVADYLKQNPDIPVQVSDVGGGDGAELLESMLGHGRAQSIKETQQTALSREGESQINLFGGRRSSSTIADEAQSELQIAHDMLEQQASKRFNDLRQLGYTSTRDIYIPGKGVTTFKGPVQLTQSSAEATKILNRFKEAYGDSRLKEMVKMESGVGSLISTLERIQETGSVAPINLDAALDIKKITGELGFGGNELEKKFGKATFAKLNHLIDNDIRVALDKFDNPQLAKQLYGEGNLIYRTMKERFSEIPTTKRLLTAPLAGATELKDILSNPKAVDKAILSSRSPETTRRALASEWLQNLLDKAKKPSAETFTPGMMYDEFMGREHDEIVRKLFTSRERASISNFFKTVRHLDPKLSQTGRISAYYHVGRAGLVLSAGVAGGLVSPDTLLSKSVAIPAAAVGVFLGGRSFVKHVLQNPANARLAARLSKLPPASTEAKALANTLFLGMKGAQVYLMTPEGVQVGTGTVENGKVKPDRYDQ